MALLIPVLISGQRIVEEKATVDAGQKIKLDFGFADDIVVKSWEKSEIDIKATVNIDENRKNDKFKFNVSKSTSMIEIESEIGDLKEFRDDCVTIIIKDGDTVIHSGNHISMDLRFEVFVPPAQEIEISTINGNMDISGLTGPMHFKTINGDVDLKITEKHKADLEMSTINGTMYTNLEMNFTKEKDNLCKIGGNINTKLNGGGPKIELETINGVIYIRKPQM